MNIKEITHKEAKLFIEKWHYSNKIPTGRNVFFGCFIDDILYAVANYGDGVNTFQANFLKKVTGKQDVTNKNMYELKRLCRIEPKNNAIPLTKFISKCHKLLKKKGIKYIVSFSDPQYGHNGGIYRAANFQNLGKTNRETHFMDQTGKIRHRRYPYKYAKRNNISTSEAIKLLKLTPYKTKAKDRWFIEIC